MKDLKKFAFSPETLTNRKGLDCEKAKIGKNYHGESSGCNESELTWRI